MRSDWRSERVRRLSPYVPGEQPAELERLIKLNTNENPYGPGAQAAAALAASEAEQLRLYPDPTGRRLREAFAEVEGLDVEQVYVSNGSDEVLSFAYAALFDGGAEREPLLLPDPSYGFYTVFAKLYDIPYRQLPLAADWQIALPEDCEGQGLVLADPNAPTGIQMAPELRRRILEQALDRGWPVIVDEAYIAFGGASAVELLPDFPNLMVVRTLSKSHGLAGLRVGAAFASPQLIGALEAVRDSVNAYPLDRVALAVAEAAVRDVGWQRETVGRIVATRERFNAALDALDFERLPSAANFVFARHPAWDGAALQKALRRQGFLVRHFATPRLAPWLRITIGRDEEMQALAETLRDLCAGGRPAEASPTAEEKDD